MRTAPDPEHLPDIMEGLESPRRAYQMGWEDGYRAALRAVTTTQEELPLTLDGESYPW